MVSTQKKEVAVDRRMTNERRAGTDRRQQQIPVVEERRKVQRRRQIDPTTCERDYTDDEIEFMQALDAYKRANGRMFPTCSEILEVIRDLGYARMPLDEDVALESEDQLEESTSLETVAEPSEDGDDQPE